MRKKMVIMLAALFGLSSLVVLGSSPKLVDDLLETVRINPITEIFSSEKKTDTQNKIQNETNSSSKEQESKKKIPVQVTYLFLFRHLAVFEDKAKEAESTGKDGSEYRNLYQRLANLTDAQNELLMKTAIDCSAEVKIKDETAKQIADQLRAEYQAELSSGNKPAPPKPSAELTALQNQRDEIVLKYVDILKASFGDAFPSFEAFVSSHITSNITTDMRNNAAFPQPDKKRLNEDSTLQPETKSQNNKKENK